MNTVHRIASLLLTLLLLAVVGAGCSREARKSRHLKRAEKYYQAEQYAPAEIEYLNVLKLEPVNPVAIRRLGLIYHSE